VIAVAAAPPAPPPDSPYETLSPPTVGRLRLLRASGVELDLDGLRARVDGALVHLPLKEFELLRALMENTGKVVCRRELLDKVWGTGYSDHNKTLEVHIRRLRRKLESCDDSPVRIRTIRGVGYIFDLTDEQPVSA
jgi:two-component system response regulator RegX3